MRHCREHSHLSKNSHVTTDADFLSALTVITKFGSEVIGLGLCFKNLINLTRATVLTRAPAIHGDLTTALPSFFAAEVSSAPHFLFFPPAMSVTKPYRVSIPDNEIRDLKAKLDVTTLPDELDSAGWDYGAPLADIKRLANYWLKGYDWRTEELKINEALPQFTRDINVDGFGTLNIHFVHQRSAEESAIPLLFVHGCERLASQSW